jgi:2-amino-4-hydroxy-6-hydroxymethyldihydropteridine diphosphokinase
MRVYLGLGSNVGDRAANLWNAVHLLGSTPGVQLRRLSPLYETEPVGPVAQPQFINAVAEAEVRCDPLQLLVAAKGIEERLGRTPGPRWGPRVIDLDILLYGRLQLTTERLTIPHPELWNRRFVLQPLADLVQNGALAHRIQRRLTEIGATQLVWLYSARVDTDDSPSDA